ncbi:unnamed protein product [Tilletia controversa]|uniref:Uncharacterized protein n=3 Tax=Tilletia TaxID=13289 RepID=A0A8X7MLN2_9BASI|nr:hypothetical protein CF328_g6451 [Tilletia controversa]KAE8238580.1 hypothetical protein A4X03_0g8829 [Tilletia caries]CAD6922275.1 unnamed protein product [Tilletia laevis]KAE8239964.1 hypothetical protein A4X06_0g7958 [Tilletia controversa]CAD6914212.1 unnamed protein product [Tilletia caries]
MSPPLTHLCLTLQVNGIPFNFQPLLAVDPADHCATLLLPQDAIAILPFLQDAAERELFEGPQAQASRSLPYAPSFKPTLAVLYAAQQKWTERLAEAKDTCSFALITLDMNSSSHLVISERHGLPYDSFQIVACPQKFQGWHDPQLLGHRAHRPGQQGDGSKDGNATMKEEEKGIRVDEQKGTPLQLELQGTHLFFTDDAAGLVLMKDHKALPFRFLLDERSISALTLGALEYNDTIPAALSILDTDRARFVMTGSMVADTVLQRIDTVSAHAEEVDW